MKDKSHRITVLVAALFLFSFNVSAQHKLALLVGISDYNNPTEDPDEWANISGANDVALLAPKFEMQGYKVATLTDRQATHRNIVKELEKVSKTAKSGDIVYLHFSMHGQPIEDANGDEADGWDEALIPYDAKLRYTKDVYEGEKHLLDDTLEKYFNKIRSKLGVRGMLYVVMDACHSGNASRGDDDHVRGTNEGFSPSGKTFEADRTKASNDYFSVATAKGQSPVVFLEACRSYQKNKEVRDKETNVWYGSLSYYINKAMETHTIGLDTGWVQQVKIGMEGNPRLRKQNMVIEESGK